MIVQGVIQELIKEAPGIAQSVMRDKPLTTRVADEYGRMYILIDYTQNPPISWQDYKIKSAKLYEQFLNIPKWYCC